MNFSFSPFLWFGLPGRLLNYEKKWHLVVPKCTVSPAMICGRSLRFVYAVQIVRSDSFWGIGCDFSAVTIRLRLRCVLR